MKKITILFLALLAFNLNYAQDTCATAQAITPGVTETITAIDGTELPLPDCAPNQGLNPRAAGEWYSFTATVNGVATVTSDLPGSAGADTRLHVYEGTCASLTCIAGADDIDFPNNFLSEATFGISSGTTYYIAWDDQWGAGGFDFVVTEVAANCNIYGLPYNEVFDDPVQFFGCFSVEDVDGNGFDWITQQDLDLDGDMINETFATNSMGADTGSNVNDWMISPGLMLTGGTEYELTTNYNVVNGTATGSLEAFILDGPSSGANVVATLFSNSNFTTQGMFDTLETMAYQEMDTFTPSSSGTFYIAYRSFGPSGGGFILLFDSILQSSLSTDEFAINGFNHYYNKNQSTLNLESSDLPLNRIEIYSLLGQSVLVKELDATEESIDVSALNDGMYLTRVSINGNTETFKFIKN